MTDADDFELFVRRYEDMVYATAVRLLGNRSEAEDVAQTVFLRAFERYDEVAASPSAGGWLKTVATNVCLNHLSRYRSRWRLFSEMADGGDAADGDGIDGLAISAPFDVVHADTSARLAQALSGLPDHQRVPLVLFHYDGLSYEAIANTLGISLGKLKTDMHRGRLALRRCLTGSDGPR